MSWNDGGGITVHDVSGGTLLERFDESPFALSPDGRWLARAELADVVLHPIASGEPRVVLGRHDGVRAFNYGPNGANHNGVRAFEFSPDGTLLAANCMDHTMLWNVAERKLFSIRRHPQNVRDLALSPDGDWIATTEGDHMTRIWETRTGQTLATLPGAGDMGQVVWSPDGDYLAAVTNWNRTVLVYQITGRHDVQQRLTSRKIGIGSVTPHPRLDRFTTLAYEELISWDVSASRPEGRQIGTEPGWGTALAYSPDGSILATSSWLAQSHKILVRDADTGKIRCQISPPGIVHAASPSTARGSDLPGVTRRETSSSGNSIAAARLGDS